MTKQFDEQVSEFMDGEILEADHGQIIQKLCQDEALKNRWQRYHLISDALKNNLPPAIDHEFAQNVKNALESEVTVLSPQTATGKTHLKHRIAGVAIAASVAAVAVIGVQTVNQTDELSPSLAEMPTSDQYVRMAQPQSKVGSTATIATAPALRASAQQAASKQEPKVTSIYQYHPQLNQYLLNHNQHTSSASRIQGVMPYARIVVTPSQAQKQEQPK